MLNGSVVFGQQLIWVSDYLKIVLFVITVMSKYLSLCISCVRYVISQICISISCVRFFRE